MQVKISFHSDLLFTHYKIFSDASFLRCFSVENLQQFVCYDFQNVCKDTDDVVRNSCPKVEATLENAKEILKMMLERKMPKQT